MLLGLETFSYHLAFAYGKMDVFCFIKRTAEQVPFFSAPSTKSVGTTVWFG